MIATLLRWLLAIMLIWAALGKLANPHEFHLAILAYQLPLPPLLLRTAAIVLPWLELLAGLLLAANLRREAALFWAFGLFSVFTLATLQAWIRGLNISCGCLDLRIIGIQPGSSIAHIMETPAFAAIRAALLTVAAGFLLRGKKQAEFASEAKS
jgi:putative oxidoreductase